MVHFDFTLVSTGV